MMTEATSCAASYGSWGLHRCAFTIFAHGRTFIIIANSSVDNLRLSWLLCSSIQAENQLFTSAFAEERCMKKGQMPVTACLPRLSARTWLVIWRRASWDSFWPQRMMRKSVFQKTSLLFCDKFSGKLFWTKPSFLLLAEVFTSFLPHHKIWELFQGQNPCSTGSI